MIEYYLHKYTGNIEKAKNKWFARAHHTETINLEGLAEHMASHNSPFSKGTIHGVLKDMVSCVKELCLDSKKVKLDGLAIFSIGLKTTGADSVGEFSVSTNIKSAHINALGTGEFSKKQLDLSAKFKEADKYDIVKG